MVDHQVTLTWIPEGKRGEGRQGEGEGEAGGGDWRRVVRSPGDFMNNNDCGSAT